MSFYEKGKRMKIKTLARLDWARIVEREQSFMPLECGYAGLLLMKRVTAPLTVSVLGERITIADDGFSWLQIAPKGENWWLTVMFDSSGNIAQYYFDVSLKNEIDGARSWFMDLYLDVALLPDGRMELLDVDEFDEAVGQGIISAQERSLAIRMAEDLLHSIPENRRRLESFCRETRASLMRKITA